MNRLRGILLGALLLGALAGVPLVSTASATAGFVFSCGVKLPVWPTTSGPAADCGGSATGFLQGTTTAPTQTYRALALSDPFEWRWAGYSETCKFNIPTNVKANGLFSVRNMSVGSGGDASGTWVAVWTRIGSALLGNLSSGLVSFANGSKAVSQRGTFVAHMINLGPGLFPLFLDGCISPQTR